MSSFATTSLRHAREVERWDRRADVVVIGLGSAGACAAIEAREAGASVLALERASAGGGTSAMASGQLYLGGGTPLQKACGFDDSVEAMTQYLLASCGPGPDEEKIRLFCERSVEHYQWLIARGVPFKSTFVPHTEATNPPGDDGLTYTGSELAHPWRTLAAPAPRGHNVRQEGDSGVVLMRALLAEVEQCGVEVCTDTRALCLVLAEGGRVVGVGVRQFGREAWYAAERGVVITTGGFGFNREMLARHAPLLLECLPVGAEGEDGSGIRLGMAAGGEAVRMDAGCVLLPFAKPRGLIRGILVNAHGQRFVNEDVYQAVHGEVALLRQAGQVYLILDDATFERPVFPIPVAGVAETPAALEATLDMPRGSLARTLQVYNENAARGEDPQFRKSAEWITPLTQPPYAALDLRVSACPYPFFTLGGLRTTPAGEVQTPEGDAVPGLYAAGRATSGLPAQGYSSGLSLADATFFGRLAGRSAARSR